MNKPSYELNSSDDKLLFEFESVGKIRVTKLIEYTPLKEQPHIFNLAFGDRKADGRIDDEIISDNGDMEKVLATVIQSMQEFFKQNPDKIIFFQGSNAARNRLYRAVLSKFLEDIMQTYELFGVVNNEVTLFEKGKEHEGFLVKRKTK